MTPLRKVLASVFLCGACSATQAAVPSSLYSAANCTARNTAPLDYVFCDDGVPSQGGTTANTTGASAVTVPAKYGAAENGYTGLPAKAADASTVPGADAATGTIALDVDVSIPLSAPSPGGYPLLVFMHGCCSGTKTSWEDTNFDASGEKWHYNNAWFASRGYMVVTYTARGFRTVQEPARGSTGQTQLDSRLYEINDFQHLACQMVANAGRWGNVQGAGGGTVAINPNKVVVTGGSYGGGFSWMALTDPKWTCTDDTGAPGVNMSLAAAAPRYGWTDLLYSLVPTGRHSQNPGELPVFNGCDSGSKRLDGAACSAADGDPVTPVGIPKASIVAGLYAQGTTGASSTGRTTFTTAIDQAAACLEGAYPVESNPACATTISTVLPEFLRERSAYYQNDFFTNIKADSSYRVPVFNVATLTDPLFPMHENRRMHNRLRSVVPDYPLQSYFFDNEHFVQNKAKDWGDVCGTDRHVCNNSDHQLADGTFDFAAFPKDLRRFGATTRLNRFVDFYTQPTVSLSAGQPVLSDTVSLQVCDALATAMVIPATESADVFSAPTFDDLANDVFVVDVAANQMTTSTVSANNHAADADPVQNFASNSSKCVVHTNGQSAGAGVAVFNSSPALSEDVVMIGAPTVTLTFTVTPPGADSIQLNSRLYDVFPNGDAVLIDRGPRRLTVAEVTAGTVTYQLHGNAYRFLAGHTIRVEVAQDDNPFLKNSTPPSSATISRMQLSVPRRIPVNSNGSVLVRTVNTTASAGATTVAAADFSLFDDGDQPHEISKLTIGIEDAQLLSKLVLKVDTQELTANLPGATVEFTLGTPLKVRPGGYLNFTLSADLASATTASLGKAFSRPAYAGTSAVKSHTWPWLLLGAGLGLVLWYGRSRRLGLAVAVVSLSLLSCESDDPTPPLPDVGFSLIDVTGTAGDGLPAAYQALPKALGKITVN